MSKYYPLAVNVFMDKTHSHYFLNDLDNNLLDFAYIANIFKQCEEIHSIRTDPQTNAFTGQGFMWLDSLLRILQKINDNQSCKLKRIRVYGKKDLNDNELYNNYKVVIIDKAGWTLEKLDNQIIVSRE